MSSPPDSRHPGFVPPRFENLEDRLLLTTLIIPESGESQFFMYRNSVAGEVRVDLSGSPGDCIELMAQDYNDNIGDLPGLINPTFPVGDDEIVTWSGGDVNDIANDERTAWRERDVDNGYVGAKAEIWGIYIAKCSSSTVLTISEKTAPAWGEVRWTSDLLIWDGEPPELTTVGDVTFTAPPDSGGAIVGLEFDYYDAQEDRPYYAPARTDDPVTVQAMGVFPGGALRPGITVAKAAYQMITADSDEGLGDDVTAIVVGDDGRPYTVDSGVFAADQFTDDSSFGVGLIVDSQAVSPDGVFYSVDNARGRVYRKGEPVNLSLSSQASRVDTFAVDSDGRFFTLNNSYVPGDGNASSARGTSLWRSLSATGRPQLVGYVTDADVPTFTYTMTAMAFDADNNLYGIGTAIDLLTEVPPVAPSPAGPYILRINQATALAERIQLVSGATGVVAMSFADDGTLYVVTNNNKLGTLNLDPGSGEITEVATLSVSGIKAIRFHEGLLYGVTDDTLYLIDAVAGTCTELGPAGVDDLKGLYSTPGDSTGLWSFTRHLGSSSPIRLSLDSASTLLVGDNTGAINSTYPLVDATDSLITYTDIHALDFNGEDLYAVGVAVDTDLSDGDDAPSGTFLLLIDTSDGSVTRVVKLLGVSDLSDVAFDSSGNLFGVDPDTDRLCSINTGTGAVTVIGSVPSGMVGLQFVTIGGNDALFGLRQGGSGTAANLYAINPASGSSTLLGSIDFPNAADLAVDLTDADYLWTTSSAGSYVIADIPLFAQLVLSDRGTIVSQVSLKDSAEPAYTFYNVDDMDFNSHGAMYGIAWISSLDPVNVADPDPAGPYLVAIDPDTGVVTRVAAIDATLINTLAFYDTTTHYLLDTIFSIESFAERGDSVTTAPAAGVSTLAADANGGLYWIEGGELHYRAKGSSTVRNLGDLTLLLPATLGSNSLYTLDFVRNDDPINYFLEPSSHYENAWTVIELTEGGEGDPAAGMYLAEIVVDTALPEVYSVTVGLYPLDWTPTDIAFNGNKLFATDGSELRVIDTITGESTPGVELDPALSLTGIQFVNGYLLGTTATSLYLIDPETGDSVNLGSLGLTHVSAIASDPRDPSLLYVMDSGSGEIYEVSAGSRLIIIGMDGSVTPVVDITDSSNGGPVFAIAGMDIVDGAIYAVTDYGDARSERGSWSAGSAFDSFGFPLSPHVSKQILYQIDSFWGQATAISWLWPTGGLRSLSADPTRSGVFYTTDISPASTDLDTACYLGEIALDASDMGKVFIAGTLCGRFETTASVGTIWMGFLWGNVYVGRNLDYIIMQRGGGGLREESENEIIVITPPTGSIIDVGGRLGMVDSRGGGTDFTPPEGALPPEQQAAGGVPYPLFSAVQVDANRLGPDPSDRLAELEYSRIEADIDTEGGDAGGDMLWRSGYMIDYNNDTFQYAQFLSSASGDFTITGSLGNNDASPNPDTEADYVQDWYALPLLAGQTIRIEGTLSSTYMGVRLYDCFLRFMDSFGYLTQQDVGVGSAGTSLKPMTFTAPAAGVYYISVLAFAPVAAAVYADYELYVTNGPSAELGAINVDGDYGTIPGGVSNTSDLDVTSTGLQVVGGDLTGGTVRVNNGGNLGAVVCSGAMWGVYAYARGGGDIVAFQAADMGVTQEEAQEGQQTQGATIVSVRSVVSSEGNIGGVYATQGSLYADIEAGASSGIYNHDAYIQNVFCFLDMPLFSESAEGLITSASVTIAATGSIGTINVGGTFGPNNVIANSDWMTDPYGKPGKIDLLRVGGDYRQASLSTGPGGNVGYVYVGGDIELVSAGAAHWVQPILVTDDPDTRTIIDDGGGRLVINPTTTYVFTDLGVQVIDPLTNQPMVYVPTITYRLLPVNDSANGGVGSVIVDLTSDGPVQFNITGQVHIGNLSLPIGGTEAAEGAPEGVSPMTAAVKFAGTGRGDVYHVNGIVAGFSAEETPGGGAGEGGATSIFGSLSLINYTPGDILSGTIAAQTVRIRINGSVGKLAVGSVGQWLNGPEVSPFTDTMDLSAIAYGWFAGMMNGLNIAGDLESAWIGGSLGDLRVRGAIGTIRVNADDYTPVGDWDGINGVAWAQDSIGSIYVGDGLLHYGGALLARAGIFSGGSIDAIYINGPRREVIPAPDASANVRLKGSTVYGELDGAIIAYSDTEDPLLDASGAPVLDDLGQPVVILHDAIGRVEGTNGATCTAMILSDLVRTYEVAVRRRHSDIVFDRAWNGTIGTVTFSGQGAKIYNTEITGAVIGRVITSVNSDGISGTAIYGGGTAVAQPGGAGTGTPAGTLTIGEVIAGGPGLFECSIETAGGSIGTVRGNGPQADIIYSSFVSNKSIDAVKARHIYDSEFHIPAIIGSFSTTGNAVRVDVNTGQIKTFSVGGDITNSGLTISRNLDSMTVGGSFIGTRLMISGGAYGNLRSLSVAGDISGTIVSYGRIGSIVSRNGVISADISTIAGDWNTDVDLIDAGGGFTGSLNIGGSLKKLISRASLGSNPETAPGHRSQTYNIAKNLNYLRVMSRSGAHLYASINVGGDIGTIDVDGTLYGQVTTNGNLRMIVLDGGLGGQLDVNGDGILEDVGALNVYGGISSMRFNPNTDIYADLTVGGSISKLSLRNADIRGDVTSRYGSIGSISISGGSILGKITAKSIGKVSLSGGNITGDGLEATGGGIKGISIRGGTLDADISATGTIDALSIVGSAAAGRTISAGMGMGRVSVSGELASDVVSGRGIAALAVKGDLSGSVNAETYIGALSATSDISGTVRAGGGIGKLAAGTLTGATVSSAWDIDKVSIRGTVADSFLLAGYDGGDDGVVGGGDDNPITGAVHTGQIRALSVGGALSKSVVTAGVDPGDITGGVYEGFVDTSDNTSADGASSIYKMTVKGGFGSLVTPSAILADTMIDPKFLAVVGAMAVVDYGVSTTLSGSGTDFGPDSGLGNALTIGNLTLVLSGQGVANYNAATGALVLEQTGSRSAMTITNTGPALATPIVITSSDDSGLRSLKVVGAVTLGNVGIDGEVTSLQVGTINAASTWSLPGGVKSAKVTTPNNAAITVGNVTQWAMTDAFSGAFTADAVKKFSNAASVSGSLTTTHGDAQTLDIRGNFTGQADIRGTVKKLSVAGAMSATVDVTNGDLQTLSAGSLSGIVNVARGQAKAINVSGDLSGSYRACGDLGTLKVTSGDLSGLVSVGGDIRSLSVGGQISGRARSAGSIKSVSAGSMYYGMVAAAGDLTRASIRGDMLRSYLLAGFDPGDAGYVAGETGNVRIDRFSPPASAAQADQATGGSIETVSIGGSMTAATIAAAIDPGVDGYVGTADDEITGVGYVGKVAVRSGIFGTYSGAESYGVFAASSMPVVTAYGQPFQPYSNADYGSMETAAGNLEVTRVQMLANSIVVTFSHGVNSSTISLGTTVLLYVSRDMEFDVAEDTLLGSSYLKTPTYDPVARTLTLTLKTGNWTSLENSLGGFFQIILDGTPEAVDGDAAITDNRGLLLDGDFSGPLPSGDGTAGGDFLYTVAPGDDPNTFIDALDYPAVPLSADGGPVIIAGYRDTLDDVDIFRFTAEANQFLSMEYLYLGSRYELILSFPDMCLFYHDTQGTETAADDTFEAVSRIEFWTTTYDNQLFQALELPETGEYFVAIDWYTSNEVPSRNYQLKLNLASSDVKLMQALDGYLPAGEQIGYVSNYVGQNNNYLGANSPKQLVYVNFDGGVATQYSNPSVRVQAFRTIDLDNNLADMESVIIEGSGTVTGIMDHILSIYSDTPASNPAGHLTVRKIDLNDPDDWADYLAADEGLWFTTDDPSTMGLDPLEDYTTVFVGPTDNRAFGYGPGLVGLASEVDINNMNKANNAIVFAQNFVGYSLAGSVDARLNEYSTQLANTIAHELGHTLGLNHHPIDEVHYNLLSDDPDNNPATPNDSNTGPSLMAYAPSQVETKYQMELGTADLAEFSIGQADHVSQLLWWLT